MGLFNSKTPPFSPNLKLSANRFSLFRLPVVIPLIPVAPAPPPPTPGGPGGPCRPFSPEILASDIPPIAIAIIESIIAIPQIIKPASTIF